MKPVALCYILCFAHFSTYIAAAPPIVHPSIIQLNSGNTLGNLTSSTSNAAPHTNLGLVPPPAPFNLHVPNSNLLLMVSSTSYIHDRIEHWAHQALRAAYEDVIKHPRSESILNSIFPDLYLRYDGNPDESASGSTDVEMVPQHNLTYGLFADCIGVMSWFVLTYPEWDFAYDVGIAGTLGSMGHCGLATR